MALSLPGAGQAPGSVYVGRWESGGRSRWEETIAKSGQKFTTIDEYIATLPEKVRGILEELRATISESVPEADEAIAYGIPTFKLNGNLIHFAAWTNHISIYPVPGGSPEFEEELSAYKRGKGTLQFPIDKPVPADLIKKIVEHRVREHLASRKKG